MHLPTEKGRERPHYALMMLNKVNVTRLLLINMTKHFAKTAYSTASGSESAIRLLMAYSKDITLRFRNTVTELVGESCTVCSQRETKIIKSSCGFVQQAA
jgi:hypothetical protein